jgi:hypothetical protein
MNRKSLATIPTQTSVRFNAGSRFVFQLPLAAEWQGGASGHFRFPSFSLSRQLHV